MMYLSQLLIDVGSDPDRPRPGRRWLSNIYHVHQRLSMAFPTPVQCAEDPHFLRPFNPAGFNPASDQRSRFLFRIDNGHQEDGPRAIILVQSELEPDWEYAFQNANMFLAAPPQSKEYNPDFQAGDSLRFRIRINLSKKSKNAKSQDGTIELRKPREGTDAKGRQRDQGKRIAFTWNEEQGPDQAVKEWFAAKSSRCGFELNEHDFSLLQLGWVTGWRPKGNSESDATEEEQSGRHMRFRSALLEGRLKVTDATVFAQAWASGIGAAKGFGFGLLSIAPV